MNCGTQKTDEIVTLKTEAEQEAKGRWSFAECSTLKKFLSDNEISHLLTIFNNAHVNYEVLTAMSDDRLAGLGLTTAMRVIIHEAFGRDVRTHAPSNHLHPSRSTAVSLRRHSHHQSVVMWMRRVKRSFQPMCSQCASAIHRSTAPARPTWRSS